MIIDLVICVHALELFRRLTARDTSADLSHRAYRLRILLVVRIIGASPAAHRTVTASYIPVALISDRMLLAGHTWWSRTRGTAYRYGRGVTQYKRSYFEGITWSWSWCLSGPEMVIEAMKPNRNSNKSKKRFLRGSRFLGFKVSK